MLFGKKNMRPISGFSNGIFNVSNFLNRISFLCPVVCLASGPVSSVNDRKQQMAINLLFRMDVNKSRLLKFGCLVKDSAQGIKQVFIIVDQRVMQGISNTQNSQKPQG